MSNIQHIFELTYPVFSAGSAEHVIISLRIDESSISYVGLAGWLGIYDSRSRPKHTQHHIDYQNYTRQQTITNDYCRQQTFNQRLSLDRWRFFAA